MHLWKQYGGWEREEDPDERPEKDLIGGGREPGLLARLDGREQVQEMFAGRIDCGGWVIHWM